MSDFALLAQEIVKRPRLAQIWQGLVARTRTILFDSQTQHARAQLLDLSNEAKDEMQKAGGSNEITTTNDSLEKLTCVPVASSMG